MVKKVLLVAFASLHLSLAAPVPAKEDLPPTEVHHRQPRPFFVFDNSIPGTIYPNQTLGGPKISTLFPNFPLPVSVVLPAIPSVSGSGLLDSRNLIRVYTQTNAATNATLGWYLVNPFENYNLNDIIGLIRGNGRSADDSPFDVGANSEIPSLSAQQLYELLRKYNQQLTSVGQGTTFNTPNEIPMSLYSPSVQGSPYDTSPYLSQFNQYNHFADPNSNSMFGPPAVLKSPLPGQESAVIGLRFGITAPIPGVNTGGEVSTGLIPPGQESADSNSKFAPPAALKSPLPGQESAVSGLPFGITTPIPAVNTGGEVSAAQILPGQESTDSNSMFASPAVVKSALPGQESAVSGLPFGITAPIPGVNTGGEVPVGLIPSGQESADSNSKFASTAALKSPLPGQESAVSGLPFGITTPIPDVNTGGEESTGHANKVKDSVKKDTVKEVSEKTR